MVTGEAVPQTVSTPDGDREYLLRVPASYDGTPTPVVMELHGFITGSEIQANISGLGAFGEGEGFITLTPAGTAAGAPVVNNWNVGGGDAGDDEIAYLAGVLDATEAGLCVDLDSVYLVGFSNGGHMASVAACALADRVAAFATIAGTLPPGDCARQLPIMAFHGTDDGFIGYDGQLGPQTESLPVEDAAAERARIDTYYEGVDLTGADDALAAWGAFNGCEPEPELYAFSAEVERRGFLSCDARVTMYVMDGGGAAWPGSPVSAGLAEILGQTTVDIDANDLIWSFFAFESLS